MKDVRSNIEDKPVGTLKIRLAGKDPKLWVKNYIKNKDNCVTVFVEMPCATDDYTIRNVERSLKIE